MKTCSRCKIEKPLTDFGGIKRVNSWCKNCCSEYYRQNKDSHKRSMQQWEKERNKELRDIAFDYLKSGCIDCGETNILTLEFDHKDAKMGRENSVARLMNKRCNPEKLIEEIKKCEIRCANCHRIKTSYGVWNSWRIEYLTN